MKFKLEIECDNAAFKAVDEYDNDAGACGEELGNILYKFSRKLAFASPGDEWSLFDHNGNRVGKAKVTGK